MDRAPRADPRAVRRAAPSRRPRRAVPVRPGEVRARARPAARGARAPRTRPTRAAACATSWSAAAATSVRTTTAPARSPTPTSTPCSCTPTRSFARLEDSFGRAAPAAVPVRYTGFVVDGDRRVAAARTASPGLRRRRAGRRARSCAPRPPRTRIAGLPMRLIAGPFCPAHDLRALRASAIAQDGLELVPHRARPGRRSCAAPPPRSASAATTPRWSSSARACPRSSCHTRRRRRTSSAGARAGSRGSAR